MSLKILTSASSILRAMPRCSRRTKEERGGENNREVSKVVGRNYATNIVRCLIDLESLQIASSSPLVSPSLRLPSWIQRSTRNESRKSTRGGRSIESNCGWSDRNSCAKKTFGFLRRKTWLFVPYFWKRWKNPFVDRMLAGQVRWIFEINLRFLIYCNFIGRLILENRKNWCRKIDVQVVYIYIYYRS